MNFEIHLSGFDHGDPDASKSSNGTKARAARLLNSTERIIGYKDVKRLKG